MITASSADAIHKGEKLARAGGIVYLFAGLRAADRDAMDEDQVIFYENLHRKDKPVHTTVRQGPHDKVLLYAGHSGYWDSLAPQAPRDAQRDVLLPSEVALDRSSLQPWFLH